MTAISDEKLARWQKLRGKGMISAVGEYTPDEFWEVLDAYEQQASRIADLEALEAGMLSGIAPAPSHYSEVGKRNYLIGSLTVQLQAAREALTRIPCLFQLQAQAMNVEVPAECGPSAPNKCKRCAALSGQKGEGT